MYAELLGPFWEQQTQEVSQVGKDAAEFKNHQLPLARIKKVSALVRSRTVVAVQALGTAAGHAGVAYCVVYSMADYNQLSMTHHRAQREPACHTTLQASCMVLGFDQVTQCWFAMHVSRSLAVLYDTCFVPSTVLLCPLLLQIMKSDEDVRMISAEAPVLFAKVCSRQSACHISCLL
eukprot:GHRQ01033211.1.p1 GENE.GHRQ01033211.1~~GHRQ01033211.1.p1  ORF type:complete len:190 (-),score=43.86 GHRQ01033211.1:177-707(-)